VLGGMGRDEGGSSTGGFIDEDVGIDEDAGGKVSPESNTGVCSGQAKRHDLHRRARHHNTETPGNPALA
jgi:hypothetical protein